MSTFVPRWSQWSMPAGPEPHQEAKTPNQRTCKTCKRAFAGFAGCKTELFGGGAPALARPLEVDGAGAEPFAGFAGSETGSSKDTAAPRGEPSWGVEAADRPFAGFAGSETGPSRDTAALSGDPSEDLEGGSSPVAAFETGLAEMALVSVPTTETPGQRTCKTCKRAFAGFAGSETSPSEMPTAFLEGRQTPGQRASKTRKRSSADQVAGMTLDEFSRAGLKLRIHSHVLACDVLFVSDNVPDNEIDPHGPSVYRAHELRKLALMKPQPHSLRCIHEVKAVFNGTIEEIGDA